MSIAKQVKSWMEDNDKSLEEAVDFFSQTSKFSKEEILEDVKSDGEDSSTMSPVATTAKKRKADAGGSPETHDGVPEDKTKEGKVAKGSKRPADKTVSESIEEIFGENADLSEDFKKKAAVIFESAVSEMVSSQVNDKVEALEEEYIEKLENLEEKLDQYLNHIVENWSKENQLEIQNSLKVEVAESFMNGLKDLFETHNVTVSEESIDVVEELTNKVEVLQDKINEMTEENINLETQITTLEVEDAFDEVSENLADTQVAKLRTLVENIEFDSVEEFTEKATIIKEKHFAKSKVKRSNVLEDLNEDVNPGDEEYVDPEIARMAESLSSYRKNFI